MIDRLKRFLKKFPPFYAFLINLFGPVFITGTSHQYLFQHLQKDSKILNVGSGPTKLRKGIINLDVYPYTTVDIVGNAHGLPIQNESCDGVISLVLLEHTRQPVVCIQEMFRILKIGGLAYCRLPFVVPYHSAPQDYYRWTKDGIKELFRDFHILKIGVAGGPTSSCLWVFQEWIAMLFSFNIKFIYELLYILLMVLTFPLKFLDVFLSKYMFASNLASTFYVIARKENGSFFIKTR